MFVRHWDTWSDGRRNMLLALPATQAAAKYNTPFLIDVGVSDAIVSRGLKNVFRLAPGNGKCVDDAFAGLSEVNKAAGSPAKTAVIVHEDSEFGTSTAKLLSAKVLLLGAVVFGMATLDKTKPVLLYCASGRRSAAAREAMTAAGFTDVKDLSGGITSWRNAGLRVK